MIPVKIGAEPENFNQNVRMKGKQWINNHPGNREYPAFWTEFLSDLARQNQRVCCYYGIYLEPNSGGETIDHFKPKSKYQDFIYEWDNYRYCCLGANRKKHIYEDVIDPAKLPLEIGKHTFEIDFSDGSIRANPALSKPYIQMVNTTIERLELNDVSLRDSRMDYLHFYLVGNISQTFLHSRAPLVYAEAARQKLL